MTDVASRLTEWTHDMDFGALLAATRAKGPSVLQVRVKNTMPAAVGADVVRVLHLRREAIERGALVTIDKANARSDSSDRFWWQRRACIALPCS